MIKLMYGHFYSFSFGLSGIKIFFYDCKYSFCFRNARKLANENSGCCCCCPRDRRGRSRTLEVYDEYSPVPFSLWTSYCNSAGCKKTMLNDLFRPHTHSVISMHSLHVSRLTWHRYWHAAEFKACQLTE